MDDPALDAATYTEVLHDLAQVNTVTLARRPTLDFLRRAEVRRREDAAVLGDLDLGSGADPGLVGPVLEHAALGRAAVRELVDAVVEGYRYGGARAVQGD